MPALSTLLPAGDSSVGAWLTDAGGNTNLYLKIDEGIAAAVDTGDYIKAPADTNNTDYKFALADTPADFGSIATLSWRVRYALSGAPPASNKDTYGLQIRIMNGTQVLAAADSAGTFQTVVSSTTLTTTFTNSAATAFAYVNTAATKADWDAAVVELRQTYTQLSAKDAHSMYVSAVEFTGTYNLRLTANTGTFTLAGAQATLKAARRVQANAGAFILAGSQANLFKTYPLVAQAGVFALTGSQAGLYANRRLTGASGSFLLSGANAALLLARLLSGQTASFAVAGSQATLRADRRVSVQAGEFMLLGSDAGLIVARRLSALAADFLLEGSDAELLAQRRLSVQTGIFILTGSDAELIYYIPPAVGYTLTAQAGAFALAGSPAGLYADRRISPTEGVFDLTGSPAELLRALRLSVESGAFAVAGSDALLRFSRVLSGASGSFDVAGSQAALLYGRVLAAQAGVFALEGMDAGLHADRRLSPETGIFVLAGSPADLRAALGYVLVAQTGVFLLTGSLAYLVYDTPVGQRLSLPERVRYIIVPALPELSAAAPNKTIVPKKVRTLTVPKEGASGLMDRDTTVLDAKRPQDLTYYTVLWAKRLKGVPIVTSVFEAEAPLEVRTSSHTDVDATVWVAGGVDGGNYLVTNTITLPALEDNSIPTETHVFVVRVRG